MLNQAIKNLLRGQAFVFVDRDGHVTEGEHRAEVGSRISDAVKVTAVALQGRLSPSLACPSAII